MLWKSVYIWISWQKTTPSKTCEFMNITNSPKFQIRRWYPNPGKNADIAIWYHKFWGAVNFT